MSFYRTRIRQLGITAKAPVEGEAAKRCKAGAYVVDVYLPGVGWLPLADRQGKEVATFATRKAARGYAGCVESMEQVLGHQHLRWA